MTNRVQIPAIPLTPRYVTSMTTPPRMPAAPLGKYAITRSCSINCTKSDETKVLSEASAGRAPTRDTLDMRRVLERPARYVERWPTSMCLASMNMMPSRPTTKKTVKPSHTRRSKGSSLTTALMAARSVMNRPTDCTRPCMVPANRVPINHHRRSIQSSWSSTPRHLSTRSPSSSPLPMLVVDVDGDVDVASAFEAAAFALAFAPAFSAAASASPLALRSLSFATPGRLTLNEACGGGKSSSFSGRRAPTRTTWRKSSRSLMVTPGKQPNMVARALGGWSSRARSSELGL
mmetsp:Transcript_54627/g.150412  ORF Transcript_54627/g.150412 Transcript_54627/m.150412 type:complete len:290 (-) Transcript_54627:156-1025(-)